MSVPAAAPLRLCVLQASEFIIAPPMYNQIKLVLTSSDRLHVNEVDLTIAPSIFGKAWSVPAAAQLRLCVLQATEFHLSLLLPGDLKLLKINQALHTKLCVCAVHTAFCLYSVYM